MLILRGLGITGVFKVRVHGLGAPATWEVVALLLRWLLRKGSTQEGCSERVVIWGPSNKRKFFGGGWGHVTLNPEP